MKVLVLLSGSGVYDGSEIHESVLTLLALDQIGATYQCIAPNKNQLHVINHITGEVMEESRNVMIESARIARGNVIDIAKINSKDFLALIIPGGFGAAKNLNLWAISGPNGEIDTDVKNLILEMVRSNKPIVALCMGPTVVAKALEGSEFNPTLTVGTDSEPSPYDIKAISEGMNSIGAKSEMKSISEIAFDEKLKIITAPCYMMEANITEVYNNIKLAVNKLKEIM